MKASGFADRQARFLVLDGVLADPEVTWFGLSREKAEAITIRHGPCRKTVTTYTAITDGQVVASCTPALNNGTPPPRPNAPVTCSATVTAGHPGAYMRVQSDGNLVMCSAGGAVLMSTGTGGQDPEAASATPQPDTLAIAAMNTSGPGGPDEGGRGAPSGLERHAPDRRTVELAISELALVRLLIVAGLLLAVTRLRGARVKPRQPQLHSQRRVGAWRTATLFGMALALNALVPAAVAGQTEILEDLPPGHPRLGAGGDGPERADREG